MKISRTLSFLLASFAVFLIAPFLPTPVLGLLAGNQLMVGVLLIAALLVLRRNIVLGLAFFLAVAALLLENRRRMVTKVQVAMQGGALKGEGAPVEELSRPAADLVKGEVHPVHEKPTFEDHGFEPEGEKEHGAGGPLDDSVMHDGKRPLETAVPHPDEMSEFFQEEGFARVGTGLAQGSMGAESFARAL